jgi:hypothetical protein
VTPSVSVPPPWIQFPQQPPTWGGWRQGRAQAWLLQTWLPFWSRLAPADRTAYLAVHPAPDTDWELYVMRLWLA